MKITKEQLEQLEKDPLMTWLLNMVGINSDDFFKDTKSKLENESKKSCDLNTLQTKNEKEIVEDKLNKFFRVNECKNTYKKPETYIKSDTHNDGAIEIGDLPINNYDNSSFSMSKDELKDFIKDYNDLESSVRKLKYNYGIDLNAGPNSIYDKYNNIIWTLIEKIFGEENREDICDFCFGNSNFDTVEDLYEELV